jgi:Domain of unknown function (DUF4375)
LEQLPHIEYKGQTTPELLACKDSHSVTSLVFAFEWGIQARSRQVSEEGLTDEERLVLAVLALDREVNNGGYHQFFQNSSRRFAPIIAGSLLRIGCTAAASATERAIAALQLKVLSADSIHKAILKKNADRDAVLDACDQEYYKLDGPYEPLLKFIVEQQHRIQLIRTTDYPRLPVVGKLSNASKLHIHLFLKKSWNPSLEEARQVAGELARKNGIPATDTDMEAAAVLYPFGRAVRKGDLASCQLLAPRSFELMHDDTTHNILHRDWVKLLLQAGQPESADEATLLYLDYIRGCDQSTLRTRNALLFWGPLLQANREVMPKSAEFFTASFPEMDLDKPVPAASIFRG